MTSRNHIAIGILAITCSLLILYAPATIAAEVTQQPAEQKATTPIDIKAATSTFQYRIEGRPDPFMPFISERANRNEDPNEIVDDNKVLTGMQLFEPSQLTLVALMATETDRFGMVQDFTGKGYIIKEGMKIGRRGVIAEITPTRVVIEETAKTRGGQVLTNEIAMVLKKEGEE